MHHFQEIRKYHGFLHRLALNCGAGCQFCAVPLVLEEGRLPWGRHSSH